MRSGQFITIVWLPLLLFFSISSATSRAAGHLAVLQYHHISAKTPPATSISPEQFEKHLAHLEKSGFVVWPLEKAVRRLQQGLSLPENSVAITMDDAYISIYTEAFPRLRQRKWPFTVFVATKYIDRGGSVFMTWDQMREMRRSGTEFAPHSHSHPYMIRMNNGEDENEWANRMSEEIQMSRKRLQEELGQASVLFAYPYGEYNLRLKKMVLNFGMIGIGQQSGVIWAGSDFGALPRYPMSGSYADMSDFKVKIRTLPLPVISVTPEDPIISASNDKPVLRLNLAPGDYRLDAISCFASGQGKVDVKIMDKENPEIKVAPRESVPFGRSRYNCTAPHQRLKRYYWHSHQWIRIQRND